MNVSILLDLNQSNRGEITMKIFMSGLILLLTIPCLAQSPKQHGKEQVQRTNIHPFPPHSFSVNILSGALPDEESGTHPGAAARAYEGVEVRLTINSVLAEPELANLIVEIWTENGPVSAYPLMFINGQSQEIAFDPGLMGAAHSLVIVRDDGAETTIHHFATMGGHAAEATIVDFETWRALSPAPLYTHLDADGEDESGENGQFLAPGPLDGDLIDHPLSGQAGSRDTLVVQLRDGQGQPAGFQQVTLTATNPNAIQLSSMGGDPSQSLNRQSDREGRIFFQVNYLETPQNQKAPSTSAIMVNNTMAVKVLDQTAVIEAIPTTLPVITRLEVERIEHGSMINDTLRTDGAILNFNKKYCFKVTLNGPLPINAGIVWRRNGRDVQNAAGQLISGTTLYTTFGDPDPADDETSVAFTLQAFVVTWYKSSYISYSNRTLKFDVRDQKTIPVNFHQFNQKNTPLELAQDIVRTNRIYNGTGVFFTLNQIVNHPENNKDLIMGLGRRWFTNTWRFFDGSLIPCVENNPGQKGIPDEIVVYNGVTLPTTGVAIGGIEAIEAGNLVAAYDICGTWINTVALDINVIGNSGFTLAHEFLHILGLAHTRETNQLICDGTVRSFGADDITPQQAAVVYANATTLVRGDCE